MSNQQTAPPEGAARPPLLAAPLTTTYTTFG